MPQPYILAQNGFTNTETSMIATACSVTFLLCMFVVNRYYAALGYRLGMTLALAALVFLLIRPSPESCSLAPFGAQEEPENRRSARRCPSARAGFAGQCSISAWF